MRTIRTMYVVSYFMSEALQNVVWKEEVKYICPCREVNTYSSLSQNSSTSRFSPPQPEDILRDPFLSENHTPLKGHISRLGCHQARVWNTF